MLAFLAIFALYVGVSAELVGRLTDSRISFKHPARALDAIDVQLTLYWAAFAVLAAVLCVVLTGWSLLVLRRYLRRRSYWVAFAIFAVISLAGVHLSVESPGGLMSLPRTLTCADHPLVSVDSGFLCQSDLKVGWRRLLVHGEWLDDVLRLKLLLNILFQIAATALVGTMLAVTSVCHAKRQPMAYFGRLTRDAVIGRMFVAGAVVLSARVFTEIVFANWPIAVVVASAGKRHEQADALIAVMSAYVFFHGALGTMVLALALLFARTFTYPRLILLPSAPDARWSGIAGRVGGWLARDATVKSLVALSPILTVLVGNPLVHEILKSMSPSG